MELLNKSEIANITFKSNGNEFIICNNNNYFKLGITEGELFRELYNGSDLQVIQSKFNISKEYIECFIKTLRQKNVIGSPKAKKNNILFYRIPIFDADNLITRISNLIKDHITISRLIFGLVNTSIILGITLLFLNWNNIISSNFLSLPKIQYVILYLTLITSIIIHEFAHGVTCKLLGGKVGKMGFILILFTPAFYCDISGVRLIENKWKKVLASFAGIYTNIFLLSISSVMYYFTGKYFFSCFALMQLGFIISNLIPFIKLDGYWILSFITEITNLYDKAIHNVSLTWKGKNIKERFIGIYGILTYCIMVISIISVILNLYGVITKNFF